MDFLFDLGKNQTTSGVSAAHETLDKGLDALLVSFIGKLTVNQKTEVEAAINALKKDLESAKNTYFHDKGPTPDTKQEALNALIQTWGASITTAMNTIDEHHNPSDKRYHERHVAIQSFLQWVRSFLPTISISSSKNASPETSQAQGENKKSWIEEKETTVKHAEKIKHFKELLDPPEDKSAKKPGKR